MGKKTICIGSDHAGFELKTKIINKLTNLGYHFIDKGCFSESSIDYADYAHPVAHYVIDYNVVGILLCGSGNGINMTANKHQGIRSALCWTPEIAKLAREHNDANILTLPARFISENEAFEIIEVFLSTPFEGGRHQKRIEKIPL
jgi:ribose 5-phosphate isomerase B